MSNTRDRVLRLLLSRSHTIEQLAKGISVTKNAIRAQIALLQREGIIEIQGVVKSARRPAVLYGLSPASDVYFSKAYPTVLSHLVLVLADKLRPEEFKTVMQQLGQRLASSAPRPQGNAQERIRTALKFLKSLGSQAEITEQPGKVTIASPVCPIARAVAADPRACFAVESLLRELTGLPVEEHCDRTERQSCQFIVKLPHDTKLPKKRFKGTKIS